MDSNTPAPCPNGVVRGLFDGLEEFQGGVDYTALTYSGYSAGLCGGALNWRQSSNDDGLPPLFDVCPDYH